MGGAIDGRVPAGLSRTDQFAEHLAQGLSVPEIAGRMGLTRGQAAGIFRRIRTSLGDQAR